VRIVELAGLQQPDALMAGEIDVAVGEPCELDNYPDIVLARLPQRPISFFCRKGHPLTRLAEPGLQDVGMFPFVGPRLTRRWSVHLPTNPVFGSMSADGKYFEPAILCPNWATILDIVRRSNAISARSRALVELPGNRADLAILPFAIPALHTEHSIMWRADRMPHPALKAFRDAVRRNEAIVMGNAGAIQVAA
jgi:DNA-binding transcriptional LysR family regulator